MFYIQHSTFTRLGVLISAKTKCIRWWSLARSRVIIVMVWTRRFVCLSFILATIKSNELWASSTEACFVSRSICSWSRWLILPLHCICSCSWAKRKGRSSWQPQIMITISKYRWHLVSWRARSASFHVFFNSFLWNRLSSFTNDLVYLGNFKNTIDDTVYFIRIIQVTLRMTRKITVYFVASQFVIRWEYVCTQKTWIFEIWMNWNWRRMRMKHFVTRLRNSQWEPQAIQYHNVLLSWAIAFVPLRCCYDKKDVECLEFMWKQCDCHWFCI